MVSSAPADTGSGEFWKKLEEVLMAALHPVKATLANIENRLTSLENFVKPLMATAQVTNKQVPQAPVAPACPLSQHSVSNRLPLSSGGLPSVSLSRTPLTILLQLPLPSLC